MKKFIIIVLLFSFAIPFSVIAQSEISGTSSTGAISTGATTSSGISASTGMISSGGDRYEAGPNVTVNTDVGDDSFAAGGSVNMTGKVGQDLFAAGGSVTISSAVGDDVRVAGGNVVIEGSIGGDLLVAGGQVEIRSGTTIGGNVMITGGNITFAGNGKGNLFIRGGNLRLAGAIGGNGDIQAESITVVPGAAIAGNLVYSSKQKSPDLEKATSGGSAFIQMQKNQGKEVGKGAAIALLVSFLLWRFLYLLVFGALLYFFFERFFLETGDVIAIRPGWSFLYGIIYFAVIPFLIIILFITIIGIPIGFLLLALYIFSFVFSKLITVTVFSGFFIERYLADKTSFWKKLGIIALVTIVVTLLSVIDFIFALFAFGALLHRRPIEIITTTKSTPRKTEKV